MKLEDEGKMRALLHRSFPLCKNGVERWAAERQRKRDQKRQQEQKKHAFTKPKGVESK
jgi:hypothetical protein